MQSSPRNGEKSKVWFFNSGIRTVGSLPSVTLLVSWLGLGLISTQVFCLSFTPQSVQCKKMNLSWLGRNADTREREAKKCPSEV